MKLYLPKRSCFLSLRCENRFFVNIHTINRHLPLHLKDATLLTGVHVSLLVFFMQHQIYTLIADCRVLSKLLLLLLYHRTSRAIRTSYSNWTHKRLAITECFHWFKQKMLCTFDLHLKTTKKLCFSSHFLLLLCITSRPQKWRKKRGSDSSINWWISVLYTVNCIPTWTQSIRTNGAKR